MAAPSFSDIFSRELDYVWNSLRRLGVPQRDLEDLVHDVFLRVFRKLDEYDPGQPLKPWLFGFAFRVASEYRRSSSRREILDLTSDVADSSPSALERIDQAERARLLQCALSSVEIERRAVLILHEIDGCPIPEVAAALELPLNTAYSRLRVARQEFRAAVERERLRRGDK